MQTDSAEFRIIGSVVDKFVATSGKFGKLVIETSVDGRRAKHSMKCFNVDVIRQIETCGAGEFITVRGSLGNEILKNRKGEEIKDGDRSIWVPFLKVESIESGNCSARPAQPAQRAQRPAPVQSEAIPDDDVPA